MNTVDTEDLPEAAQDIIRDLRRECARTRAERNEARKALAALASQVADVLTARADV